LEIIKNEFKINVIEQPMFVKYNPDQKDIKECQDFGKNAINVADTNKPL